MDPDRRSSVLTGTFYIIGTVCGGLGLGVVLGPLLSATDYLRAYGTMETRVLIASLLYLLMGVSLVAMSVAAMQTPHIMLQAPLALQEMVLGIWLIARGFSAPALASVASTGEGAA